MWIITNDWKLSPKHPRFLFQNCPRSWKPQIYHPASTQIPHPCPSFWRNCNGNSCIVNINFIFFVKWHCKLPQVLAIAAVVPCFVMTIHNENTSSSWYDEDITAMNAQRTKSAITDHSTCKNDINADCDDTTTLLLPLTTQMKQRWDVVRLTHRRKIGQQHLSL